MPTSEIYDRYKTGEIYDGKIAAWVPQPKQAEFMRRFEDEVLFGGAAGGGKSDALVAEALRQIGKPKYKGLILRKTFPQLQELIDKSLALYPLIDPKASYHSTSHTWRFSSGAKIQFGSMPHKNDRFQYQGIAYDFIGFDELTHFTWDEYDFLRSRNRPNDAGMLVYMRATANPGGVGHGWVKDRFITPAPPNTTIWENSTFTDRDGTKHTRRMSRIFIPSFLQDNPALRQNDPNYIFKLASMSEAQRNAMLYGDWDSYSGQVFREFKNDPAHYGDHRWTHVIEPFKIPKHWPIYRSFDWGFSKPFSVGWHAVGPDKTLYRIKEFYGCKAGEVNKGLEMPASEIFAEVRRFEQEDYNIRGHKIYGVADPAIWEKSHGPSINDIAESQGVYFEKGNNARIMGWQQLHERLKFDEEGRAMYYVFNTCPHFIRTVPSLVYSETHVEDVDTEGEDHIADETRYMCMTYVIEPRITVRREVWQHNPLYLYLDVKQGDLR